MFEDGSQQTFLVESNRLWMSGPLGSVYLYTAGDKHLEDLDEMISGAVGK